MLFALNESIFFNKRFKMLVELYILRKRNNVNKYPNTHKIKKKLYIDETQDEWNVVTQLIPLFSNCTMEFQEIYIANTMNNVVQFCRNKIFHNFHYFQRFNFFSLFDFRILVEHRWLVWGVMQRISFYILKLRSFVHPE